MPLDKGKLCIVSNRLPVSIKDLGQGQFAFKPSSGGLVSALQGLARHGHEFTWYGWPGAEIAEDNADRLREELLKDHNAIPVLLPRTTAEKYYNGYSNSTIWPLFHYQLDKVIFDDTTLHAYVAANEAFADTIISNTADGDQIWVHDYHLMLLPQMLRDRARDRGISIRIGWFLHTPFPGHDFFEALPSRAQLLDGILGSDIIGFQTDQARQHFHTACSKLPHCVSQDDYLLQHGREISVKTLPIGIEPADFHQRLRKPHVHEMIDCMKDHYRGCKVILGLDRLDGIKGIPQKLCAFNDLLERHSDLIGKVTLIQVAIPSRDDLMSTQSLKEEVQQLVGKINGRFSRVGYVPVHLLHTSLEPDEMTALYAIADVCFIASLRDGMNLVCYEYIACHTASSLPQAIIPGALVLSRFAGAAPMLKEAFLVNPWDKEDCSTALAGALSMSATEARERMTQLGHRMAAQTSSKWGTDFVSELSKSLAIERKDSLTAGSDPDWPRKKSGVASKRCRKLGLRVVSYGI